MIVKSKYENAVLEEMKKIPIEYKPQLLKLVKVFRESCTLNSAEESFKRGWKEVLEGETFQIENLWEDLDVETNKN